MRAGSVEEEEEGVLTKAERSRPAVKVLGVEPERRIQRMEGDAESESKMEATDSHICCVKALSF